MARLKEIYRKEIAPKLKGRTSGHLRVEKTRLRRGDQAQLARVSFVDDLKAAPVAKAAAAEKSAATKPKTTAKAAKKTNVKAKQPAKETK